MTARELINELDRQDLLDREVFVEAPNLELYKIVDVCEIISPDDKPIIIIDARE
jgi:hypothetical protein